MEKRCQLRREHFYVEKMKTAPAPQPMDDSMRQLVQMLNDSSELASQAQVVIQIEDGRIVEDRR
jgi:hypothetical protein